MASPKGQPPEGGSSPSGEGRTTRNARFATGYYEPRAPVRGTVQLPSTGLWLTHLGVTPLGIWLQILPRNPDVRANHARRSSPTRRSPRSDPERQATESHT